MNYRLDKYGAIEAIPPEEDINSGGVVVADQPTVPPALAAVLARIPPEQIDAPLPVTARTWALISYTIGTLVKQVAALEQRLNEPSRSPM